jgi:hypothetical protein
MPVDKMADFRKRLMDDGVSDGETLSVALYEKVCELYPVVPDALFPIGMDPLMVETQPLILETPGWGRLEAPTVSELLRKVVTAYESLVADEYAKAQARKAGSQEG